MMYRTSLCCVAFAVCVGRIVEGGNPPRLEWQRTFSGSGNDYGKAVRSCRDGGYVIAGTYEADIAVIKTDAEGLVEWQVKHGDGSRLRTAEDIQQMPDGGFITVGMTCTHEANSYDVYLIRLGDDGRLLWSKRLGQDRVSEWANAIRPCADGGFIIAGATYESDSYNGDAYLVRIDDEGNQIWSASFGTPGIERALAVEETSDGGYIMAGATHHSLGGLEGDVYLVKTSADGVETWSRSFGGGFHDEARSVRQTTDGGYIITGTAVSFDPAIPKLYLLKTNSRGMETWSRTIAGYCEMHGYSVLESVDGGYIVGGTTRSSSEYCAADGCVLKTDREGTVQWLKVVGAGGDIFDEGYCVEKTADGGYVLAGATGWSESGGRYHISLAKLHAETEEFMRGDANGDGMVDIADAIRVLMFLFMDEKVACRSAADANDDGMIDVSDVLKVLYYLFERAGPLPEPFGRCSVDSTIDTLGCGSFPPCH